MVLTPLSELASFTSLTNISAIFFFILPVSGLDKR
jgi:hypothetical protein